MKLCPDKKCASNTNVYKDKTCGEIHKKFMIDNSFVALSTYYCPWCGKALVEEPKKQDCTQEYRLHYEMWDWLSENPGKEKHDWLVLNGHTYIDSTYECFLCELHRTDKGCPTCPLEKIGEGCRGYGGKGFFNIWNETGIDQIKIEYARKIRDVVLPYLDKPVKKESALDKYIDEAENIPRKAVNGDFLKAMKEIRDRLNKLEGK